MMLQVILLSKPLLLRKRRRTKNLMIFKIEGAASLSAILVPMMTIAKTASAYHIIMALTITAFTACHHTEIVQVTSRRKDHTKSPNYYLNLF